MRPTQRVGGLYLTVADSLAPLPSNNSNNNKGDQADKPLNSSLITITILRKPESKIRILICQ